MYLDFSPYFDLLKKKKPLSELTDDELAKKLAKREAILDPRRRAADAFLVPTLALFSFSGVGFPLLAIFGIGSSLPMIGACAAAYGIYKGGAKLLCMATVRAVNNKFDLKKETDLREINRLVVKAEMDRKAAEARAAAIVEEANRAKEAFNRAIRAGLPLEQAIQVKKSPLVFRPKQTV